MVWSVAAFGASKALSLLSLLVLARLLAPDQFGVVAAVAAYIALIELGSDIGMKPADRLRAGGGPQRADPDRVHLNLADRGGADAASALLLAPAVAGFFGVRRRRRAVPPRCAQPAPHRARQRPRRRCCCAT